MESSALSASLVGELLKAVLFYARSMNKPRTKLIIRRRAKHVMHYKGAGGGESHQPCAAINFFSWNITKAGGGWKRSGGVSSRKTSILWTKSPISS